MGRFTRAKMNKQMVRDDRAERAIKRMPIKTAVLLVFSLAFLLVAYHMHFEELYIGEVQVLPYALGILGILLAISFITMGFRYAYHRGLKIKTLLIPLCHGIGMAIVIFIFVIVESGADIGEVLNVEIGSFIQPIAACGSPTLLGVILGWISRLLFRRRDI